MPEVIEVIEVSQISGGHGAGTWHLIVELGTVCKVLGRQPA